MKSMSKTVAVMLGVLVLGVSGMPAYALAEEKEPAMQKNDWEALARIAKAVAVQFGNNCEVVIHDLTAENAEHSIVAIENVISPVMHFFPAGQGNGL